MASSYSMMNKKKNRHFSDSNTKSTVLSAQPVAMKASLSGTNLNAKKNFQKIQQDFLNRKKSSGLDDLFFNKSTSNYQASTNSNKEIKRFLYLPNFLEDLKIFHRN